MFKFNNDVLEILLATLVLMLSSTVLYKCWKKILFWNKVKNITGPPALPLIGNAHLFIGSTHDLLNTFCTLMKKYNGLSRIWFGPRLVIYMSNPEDLEIFFNSKNCLDKDEIYEFFKPGLGEGLFTSAGDLWKNNRKLIAPSFNASILKQFVQIFNENSKTLVKKLHGEVDKKYFDAFPYIRNCSVDFILKTSMKLNYEAQDNMITEILECAEKLMDIMYQRIFKAWLYPDFIFNMTEQGKQHDKCVHYIQTYVSEVIEKIKRERDMKKMYGEASEENEDDKKTFLSMLLDLNDKETGTFTDEQLRDEMLTMIITGYETTAATLCFVLMMLGIHQEIQDRVYKEIISIQQRLQRPLQYQDMVLFSYTDQVIKETLRMFPVGPVIGRKVLQDTQFKNFVAPKGSSVGAVLLSTHRDPKIWNEPNVFNPDNFLPDEVAKRHPYSYVPFSAGPRGCIGQKYAMTSMKIMLSHILQHFQIFCESKVEDIKMKSEVTMKSVGGFPIKLIRRKLNLVQS